jgi:hypothetical protein
MSINSSCNGNFFTANIQCTLHWTTSWRPSSLPSFFTGEKGRELGLLSFFLLMLEEIYLLKCGAVCFFAASSQIQMGDLIFFGSTENLSLSKCSFNAFVSQFCCCFHVGKCRIYATHCGACFLAAFFTKSMQNTPRDNLSNSTVDSQFWVLMLFVTVCQFFLLMLSFTWGKF